MALIYEDELPPMTDDEYSRWFDLSTVDGVRVGPSCEFDICGAPAQHCCAHCEAYRCDDHVCWCRCLYENEGGSTE